MEKHSTLANKSLYKQHPNPYPFYYVLPNHKLTRFNGKHVSMEIDKWTTIFSLKFNHLVYLNLTLSCNDQILKLIPKHCPVLEYLNATAMINLNNDFNINASMFMRLVTDEGIEYLCNCKCLKKFITNNPRSLGRGARNGITYSSFQKLLLNVSTLEDIVYKNIGSVICTNFENVLSLNLKVIRQVQPTVDSIREILRLCKKLEELHLTIFEQTKVLPDEFFDLIINSECKLKIIKFDGIQLYGYKLNDFLQKCSPYIIILKLTNINLSANDLKIIGENCLNIRTIWICNIIGTTRDSNALLNDKIEIFSKLNDLSIMYDEIDIENILKYCTKNATTLKELNVCKKPVSNSNEIHSTLLYKADELFLNGINISECLEILEIGKLFVFTKNGIRDILFKYSMLQRLTVYALEDCKDVIDEMQTNNYNMNVTIYKYNAISDEE